MSDRTLDFTGQNVLITGASRGIGRAAAKLFAEHGAGVLVHYNSDLKAAEETVAELEPGNHHVLQADLSDAEEVRSLSDAAIDVAGRVHVLVNNAGIWVDHKVAEVSFDEWRQAWERTIAINLLGPVYLAHGMIQHMIEQGGGRVVNVTSRGAFRGEPDGPAYGAAKAGLNAAGQSLAKAVGGRNVFVYNVAPGFVATEMATEFLAGPRGDFIRNESPLGRVAKPEEVAWTIMLLAAPGSDFMTGAIVYVDGGGLIA